MDKLKEFFTRLVYDISILFSSGIITVIFLLVAINILDGTIFERYYYEVGMDKAIDRASNEDYPYMISELCSLKKSELSKIYCVYGFISNILEYGKQPRINPIEYSLKNDSDCKNSVVVYCSIFKNLNLQCNPVILVNHTFALVEFDEGYCNIDQKTIDCIFLEG